MRKWIRIAGFAALALAAMVFFSCGLFETPVSITERITTFVTSLNGDRSTTKDNLDTLIPAYAAVTAAWWENPFAAADKTYTVDTTGLVTTDPTDVQVSIKGANGFNKLYKFSMVNTGTLAEVWVIHDLSVSTGTSTWASIFTSL